MFPVIVKIGHPGIAVRNHPCPVSVDQLRIRHPPEGFVIQAPLEILPQTLHPHSRILGIPENVPDLVELAACSPGHEPLDYLFHIAGRRGEEVTRGASTRSIGLLHFPWSPWAGQSPRAPERTHPGNPWRVRTENSAQQISLGRKASGRGTSRGPGRPGRASKRILIRQGNTSSVLRRTGGSMTPARTSSLTLMVHSVQLPAIIHQSPGQPASYRWPMRHSGALQRSLRGRLPPLPAFPRPAVASPLPPGTTGARTLLAAPREAGC